MPEKVLAGTVIVPGLAFLAMDFWRTVLRVVEHFRSHPVLVVVLVSILAGSYLAVRTQASRIPRAKESGVTQ